MIEDLDLIRRIAVSNAKLKACADARASIANEIDKNEGQRIETHGSLHIDISSCFTIPIFI